MNFLSLQEPEPISSRHLTRTESILVSVVAHLLILLLLLGANRLRDYLPESILALFEENPSSLTIAQMAAADDESVQPPEASSDKIPLEFTYVKVPKDTAVDRNPDAPLLSDKNRRARQEIPTPEDATLFSIDPHSEGDSIDRVSPDPAIPEGEDSPDPQHPGEQGLSTVHPPEENGPGTTGGEGSGGLAGPGDGTAGTPVNSFGGRWPRSKPASTSSRSITRPIWRVAALGPFHSTHRSFPGVTTPAESTSSSVTTGSGGFRLRRGRVSGATAASTSSSRGTARSSR